jgi:hypothetical protein
MLKAITLTLLLAASILQTAYSDHDYEERTFKSHKHKQVNLEPVVTQRSAEVPANPSGTTEAGAECNPDEVVTGGGYEISELRRVGGGGSTSVFINTSFKEFAEDNSWHVEIVNPDLSGTVTVHAECLKLVPT